MTIFAQPLSPAKSPYPSHTNVDDQIFNHKVVATAQSEKVDVEKNVSGDEEGHFWFPDTLAQEDQQPWLIRQNPSALLFERTVTPLRTQSASPVHQLCSQGSSATATS